MRHKFPEDGSALARGGKMFLRSTLLLVMGQYRFLAWEAIPRAPNPVLSSSRDKRFPVTQTPEFHLDKLRDFSWHRLCIFLSAISI